VESNRFSFLEVSEANVLATLGVVISSTGKYVAALQATLPPSGQGVSPPASASTSTADLTGQQIAVYTIKDGKLVRAIGSPKPSQTVLDFAFSDGVCKNLAVVWSQPEPQVAIYRWYSGKLVATLQNIDITRLCFDPSLESHLIATTTQSALRLEVEPQNPVLLKRSLNEQAKVGLTQALCVMPAERIFSRFTEPNAC
jgi:hypothetical protein